MFLINSWVVTHALLIITYRLVKELSLLFLDDCLLLPCLWPDINIPAFDRRFLAYFRLLLTIKD